MFERGGEQAQEIFGREEEMARVRQWCVEGARPGVGLVQGMAGVGKSMLCRAALRHEEVPRFIWIDAFELVGDRGPEQLLESVSVALELEWDEQGELLARYLEKNQHLIVVDNAEELDEVEVLSWLERHAYMSCGWLWVTRRLTGLMTGSAVTPLVRLGPLDVDAGYELVKAAIGEGMQLEREHGVQLIEALDGHPFALRICGAMVRWAGVEGVLTQLAGAEDGFELASWLMPGLESVFERSWDRLGEDAQGILERLCVLRMPVPVIEAVELLGAHGDVLGALGHAHELGLIARGMAQGVGWIDVPQSLRLFCLDRFHAREASYRSFLGEVLEHVCLKYARAWSTWQWLDDVPLLEALIEQRLWLARLMDVALEKEAPGCPEALGLIVWIAHLASGVVSVQVRESLRHGIEQWRRQGLDSTRSWELLTLEAELLLYELSANLDPAHLEHVKLFFEEAYGGGKQLRPREERELALQWKLATQLAWGNLLLGELASAQEWLAWMETQERDLRKEGWPVTERVVARSKMRRASLAHMTRDMEPAQRGYEEALRFAQRSQDRRTEAMTAQNLGVLHTDLCQLDRAEAYLSRAAQVGPLVGSAMYATGRINLGMVYLRQGETTQARAMFEDAASWMERGRLSADLGVVEANLGMVALDARDMGVARRHLEQGRLLAGGRQDTSLKLTLDLLESNIELWERREEHAQGLIERGFEEAVASGELYHAFMVCFGLLKICLALLREEVSEAVEQLPEMAALVASQPQVYTEIMYEQVRTWVLMAHARHGLVREQKERFSLWIEQEMDMAMRRERLPSESVRFVQGVMKRALSWRERSLWELFNEEPSMRWTGKWLFDENAQQVISPTRKVIDLRRQEQLFELLRCLHQGGESEGGWVSLEVMQEALWPDEFIQSDAAYNRIHVALSKLRSQGLGEWVQRNEDGYRLDPEQEGIWRGRSAR